MKSYGCAKEKEIEVSVEVASPGRRWINKKTTFCKKYRSND